MQVLKIEQKQKWITFLVGLSAVALISTFVFKNFFPDKFSQIQYKSESLFPADSTIQIDTNEFAPNHPRVKMGVLEQLKSFPNPRYKNGHKLLPNIQWVSPAYLSGKGFRVMREHEMINLSDSIQLELAKNWNYYLLIPGNAMGNENLEKKQETFPSSWVDLANAHPELPLSVTIFWAQVKPQKAGFSSKTPYIINQKLPEEYYVQNYSNKRKRISPIAPLDSIIQDGLTQKFNLQNLLRQLKRPINLINENGEVLNPLDVSKVKNDSKVVADKEKSGIKNWEDYLSEKRKNIELAYRDQFMSLTELKNTAYTEYAIDGQEKFRHKYAIARNINTKLKGRYYSTPDFYPRWPRNWKNWSGAWHGLKWITDSRVNEIAAGDSLFSPYVAAGWDKNEEKNIRPAQWLGLMKILGVMGAEFYYPAFFNLKAPFPQPENYVWQAIVPCYAQAITSYYEDILKNGYLLNSPTYNLASEDNIVVMARKHNTKNKYVISGTIQPNSNNMGETPQEAETKITIDGEEIKIKVRKQGSTYIYDKTNPEKPIFYQLDSWHETSHPARWINDIAFEIELFEHLQLEKIITEKKENNFTSFTSFIKLNEKQIEQHFQSKQKQSKVFVWLRIRNKPSQSVEIKISLNDKEANYSCPETKDWKWVQATAFLNEGMENKLLKLKTTKGEIEIDKILITEKEKLDLK